ncbi:hypothetical protein MRB53_016305 [Persea americana]|uniref:Uncharacterized protein n=1 Tax=Persea americana TaxID=3435 RepID=A0ACC2M1G4_PERAE|nr:hypothetical protein MRB53_016305 [Persea americana]
MTRDKSLFSTLNDYDGGAVTFGAGNVSKVVGKGTVNVPNMPLIEDVLCVDGLKHNLLSISQICDKDHDVIFTSHGCEISKIGKPPHCLLTVDDPRSSVDAGEASFLLPQVSKSSLIPFSKLQLPVDWPGLGRPGGLCTEPFYLDKEATEEVQADQPDDSLDYSTDGIV